MNEEPYKSHEERLRETADRIAKEEASQKLRKKDCLQEIEHKEAEAKVQKVIADKKKKWQPPGRAKRDSVKCLTPGCKFMYGTDDGGGRGLCKACHNVAFRLVKQGKTSWEELEEFELAEPKAGSLFEACLMKAKALKAKKDRETSQSEVKNNL